MFVVLRLDDEATGLADRLAAVQVLEDRAAADSEAARLNSVNEGKACKYVVLPSREYLA